MFKCNEFKINISIFGIKIDKYVKMHKYIDLLPINFFHTSSLFLFEFLEIMKNHSNDIRTKITFNNISISILIIINDIGFLIFLSLVMLYT